jgi:hypothetical protein
LRVGWVVVYEFGIGLVIIWDCCASQTQWRAF